MNSLNVKKIILLMIHEILRCKDFAKGLLHGMGNLHWSLPTLGI